MKTEFKISLPVCSIIFLITTVVLSMFNVSLAKTAAAVSVLYITAMLAFMKYAKTLKKNYERNTKHM